MSLQFNVVVLGMVLIFGGMSWGMWELYKKLVEIKKILEEECPCEKEP